MLLRATDLVASHPGRPRVLDGAGLLVERGRALVLLGANGSGKTTLLRCLSGSLRPTAGSIETPAGTLRHTPGRLTAHRRFVQLVRQDPDDQLFSADVIGDVSFGPLNLGLSVDGARARTHEALALMGAAALAERATHQLSHGERKRVAIAGAVAMAPALLLLDEPTAGLDPVGVHTMLAALTRLQERGTTVVMATHDVDLALAWGDEAAVVCDGTVRQGPAADLLDDDDLLARAALHRPWPLELAARLGLPGRPRTLDDITHLLEHHHA